MRTEPLDLDAACDVLYARAHIGGEAGRETCEMILFAAGVPALVAEVEWLKRERNRFGKLADRASRDRQSLVAEIERLRELLTWHATPEFEKGHEEGIQTVYGDEGTPHRVNSGWCRVCNAEWPCMTEQARRALHPEEPSDD